MTSYGTPTGETALVIVPPRDICGFANHYRQMYMPEFAAQIEPHITVTYPFTPYERLVQIAPRLRAVLAKVPPVYLSIRGFDVFLDSGVLYLRLAHPERVLALYKAVLEEFPEYPAYGGQFGDNLLPHLSVGIFSNADELARVYNELSWIKLYIGWDVERLTIKYRTSDGTWLNWGEIPLLGEARS